MRCWGESKDEWGATGRKCFRATEEEDFGNLVKDRLCLLSNVHSVALVLPTEIL